MPKCQHDEIGMLVSIEYEVQANVEFARAKVINQWPVALRASCHCNKCSFTAVFTAYPNREDGFGWSRWPKWLIRRLGLLSHESPAVHEALEAFRFRTVAYA